MLDGIHSCYPTAKPILFLLIIFGDRELEWKSENWGVGKGGCVLDS